jgi:hypothetical protein
MEVALTIKNDSGTHAEEREFSEWLRRTAERLKRGDVPPENWERRNPLEDRAVQRRIGSLISRIAVKEKRGRH